MSGCINELYFGITLCKSENEILNGWHQHFERLEIPHDCPHFDQEYQKLVDLEFNEIVDICQYGNNFIPITSQEVTKAIKPLNTGKSNDIFNIKSEHFIYAIEAVTPTLVNLFNTMLRLFQTV